MGLVVPKAGQDARHSSAHGRPPHGPGRATSGAPTASTGAGAPVSSPASDPFEVPLRPVAAAIDARKGVKELRLAQMNAWNLFDTRDDMLTADTVLQPHQYRAKLDKLAAVIGGELKAPDVVGFQEIENERVLLDLASHDRLRDLGYEAVVAPLNDARGIRTGLLYRTDILEATGARSPNPVPYTPLDDGAPGQLNHALLYSRAPLQVDFRVRGAADDAAAGQQLSVLVGHFKSKIGGDRYEPRRELQGAYLGGVVDGILRDRPDRPVAVLADLNADIGEGAYNRLVKNADGKRRLQDAVRLLPKDERYSYVFKGEKNLLDHVLVSDRLDKALVGTSITRFNTGADDRNYQWDPSTVRGSSDHDFVTATIDLTKLVGKRRKRSASPTPSAKLRDVRS